MNMVYSCSHFPLIALQFEDALAKKQKTFSLDAPLSDADREFLQAIFVPALPHHSMVDFSRLTDEKIQGYAIVLKIIAGKKLSKYIESFQTL